jgi:hypothetical protein
MTYSIETPTANQVTRDMIPLVGDCHLKTVGKHIRDGTDYDGTQIAPPLEETLPGTDRNGGKRPAASARRMAAGVRPTVQTGDIGEYAGAAWNRTIDQELADAVQTGDIGAPNDCRPHGGTASRGYPGATEPGKR